MLTNLEQQIIDTYYKDYQFFFDKPNVIGIAYGYKITNGICTCEPSIHVYVRKKLACNCLGADGVIPSLYKGIKTDVIDSSSCIAGKAVNKDMLNSTDVNCSEPNGGPYTGRKRPIQPGWDMSISQPSPGFIARTGTFGYIVTDNEQVSRTFCLLSTNATFADLNRAQIEDIIVQPSYYYGGRAPLDIVARLLRYKPIIFSETRKPKPRDFNVIDASVASLYNVWEVNLIDPRIPEIRFPTGIGCPQLLKSVQWTGCKSGYQRGTILSIKGMFETGYTDTGLAWFKDSMVVSRIQSHPWDYGALVLDLDKKALGLLYNNVSYIPPIPNAYYNLVCPIQEVLSDLKITLLTRP